MRGISKSRSLETSKSKLKFNFEQLLNQLKFQAKKEMKEKKRIGFTSQGYEAPRAESVAVAQESILCASPSEIGGGIEQFTIGGGAWDGLGGGPEGMTETNGSW